METGDFEGTKKLIRNLFRMVSSGSVSVPASSNFDLIVDEVPELFHAFYLHDAFHVPDPGGGTVDVILHGPGMIDSMGAQHQAGIAVTLFKRRKTGAAGATQQEVRLLFSNSTGVNATLSYVVFRILGLIA